MPVLCLKVGEELHRISFEPGPSIRDILETSNYRVRSGCHGIGACGLCRVRIISGAVTAPTLSDQIHLSAEQLAAGVRLACQVRPRRDLCIEILNPAVESRWRMSPEGVFQRNARKAVLPAGRLPADVKRPCGVAIDIGTTNLCLSLYDLADGRWLTDRWGPNPQAEFGADVLTRLTAAAASASAARAMSEQVVNAIQDALLDIASREGIDLRRVVDVRIVGNTAMLALLSGKHYEWLLQPERWTAPLDCAPDSTASWVAEWGIHPRATVQVVAPLAGFVGSDLLAGLVAVRFTQGHAPALFVDFGTNSEIALWDGKTLWVTAAAGGPAFERSGIRHAVPAEPGAVFRVTCENGAEPFDYRIIGDDRAKGLCGSGLIDLIACLLKSGTLSTVGKFSGGAAEFTFSIAGTSMSLTRKDIDVLQRAKAAMGVGMRALCETAAVRMEDLQRVCVAGVFGRFLDVPNAQAIGLLPAVAPENVELVGNAALAGCCDVLLSVHAAEHLERMRDMARVINLAGYPHFDEAFLECLYLRPLRIGEP